MIRKIIKVPAFGVRFKITISDKVVIAEILNVKKNFLKLPFETLRRIKGKAKCSADDVFNEAVGVRLAIARCYKKLLHQAAVEQREFINMVRESIQVKEDYIQKHSIYTYPTDKQGEVVPFEYFESSFK